MPPLDSTVSTHRPPSNNSCTGGSTNAAANKSTNSTQRTQIAKLNYPIGSSKNAQNSTGVRISALDALKKPNNY